MLQRVVVSLEHRGQLLVDVRVDHFSISCDGVPVSRGLSYS